jgi:DNA helicase-2/ATP-dependent DNA helicase PcrA
MPARNFTIETLWRELDFKPTPNQKDAILHLDGPLYLLAGPRSGKTGLLLFLDK